LVLIVDTYHHIEDRIDYFGALQATLRPEGRLVVLEYKPGDLPVGPSARHKISPEVREKELQAAGYALIESYATHQYHDFEVWAVAETR